MSKIKKMMKNKRDLNNGLHKMMTISKSTGDWHVEGWLSKYGMDSDGDFIVPGAFTEAISKKSRYPMNYEHAVGWAQDKSIGYLELEDRAEGVWAKGMFYDDIPEAERIHRLVKDGAYDSMSIGMYFRDDDSYEVMRDEEGYFTGYRITKASIEEGSIVGKPANAGAKIAIAKNLEGDLDMQKEFKLKIKSLKKHLESNPDDEEATKELNKVTKALEAYEAEETDSDDINDEEELDGQEEALEDEIEDTEEDEESEKSEDEESEELEKSDETNQEEEEAPQGKSLKDKKEKPKSKKLQTLGKNKKENVMDRATRLANMKKQFLGEVGNSARTGDFAGLRKYMASVGGPGGVPNGEWGDITIDDIIEDMMIKVIEEYGSYLKHASIRSLRGLWHIPVEIDHGTADYHDEGVDDIAESDINIREWLVDVKAIAGKMIFTAELELMSSYDMGATVINALLRNIVISAERHMLSDEDVTANKGLLGVWAPQTIYDNGVTLLQAITPGKITYEDLANMRGKLKSPGARTWYMNSETFFSTIVTLKDTEGRYIYKEMPLTSDFQYSILGDKVEFTDALPVLNTATPTAVGIVLDTDGTYQVNAPKGLAPTFINDTITMSDELKTKITGYVFLGGRKKALKSAVAFRYSATV